MRRLLQINLFLSSLLVLLAVSCSPVSGHRFVKFANITENEVRPVINKNNSLLFKAKIDLYSRHFSGLIILKQIEPAVSRLTFVTEIGMKMFDYEITDNTFKLVYVFEPLNKPKILKLLENDLKLILLQHLMNKPAAIYENKAEIIYKVKNDFRYYYQATRPSSVIGNIIKKGPVFTKVKVNYNYADSVHITRVRLKHKGFIRLTMELNTLDKSSQQ